MWVIYKHTCEITGKSYIGLTANLEQRTRCHRDKRSGCRLLVNAIGKYGWNTFTTTILRECLSLDEANEQERSLIESHNTLTPNGYNLRTGGESHVLCEESRQLIREARIGSKMTPTTRAKMQAVWDENRGKPRSPEIRNRISAALTGTSKPPITDDHRRKLSKAKQGIKLQPDQVERIKEMRRGRVWITNGEINRAIKKEDQIPDGWRAGRTLKPLKSAGMST